jgi:malate dehydrogenase (oxaloacetate-decarboxylating)
MLDNLAADALALHAKHRGKLATAVTSPIDSKDDLSLIYTPGVAEVSRAIAADKKKVYDYTIKGHTVAVVTDGSAVLGLGNIGPEASLPVMEGKAAIFKTFANIDAFPIALNTQDTDEIIRTVRAIAPVFGGINLEDISAPRCFEIEDALQDLGIPVMHDDQHGTAIVVLAGLINAFKLKGKDLKDARLVLLGAGAAGSGIARLIADQVGDLILVDSKGIVEVGRDDLVPYKRQLAEITNHDDRSGSLQDALAGADVFIGISKGNLLTPDNIKLMNDEPVIFAMANPDPEILPDAAKQAGAYIVATGRSDFPNQVNNSLVFPGIFKGALEARAPRITHAMKLAAARALAGLVTDPTPDKIIPEPFDPGVTEAVTAAIKATVE